MSSEQTDNFVGASQERQLSLVAPLPTIRRPGLMNRALESVIPEKSKLFGFMWLLAIAAIALLFGNIQGAATQFHGIAESQQQNISFQYPVEIVEIPVVEGEQVDAQAPLLKVRRYDLDVNLAVIDEKINEIEAQRATTRRDSTGEIATLTAERLAQLEKINTRIHSLETRYQLNQALADSISSDSESTDGKLQSPLLVQIAGLKAEKKKVSKLFEAKINPLKQGLEQSRGPDEARIAELEKLKNELLRQSEALSVRAPFGGSIGSVMFKPGEQVDAFEAVMSIHGSSTRHIKGFIHEAVFNDVRVGQIVWINTHSDEQVINGIVESLGSRIVEYPERLKRSPLVSAWGREAIISLQQENKLLLGEKVTVLLKRPEPVFQSALAYLENYLPISQVRAWAIDVEIPENPSPMFIDVRIDGIDPVQLEASGITWNPGTQSYWVVSDEQAAIFELSPGGDIVGQIPLDQFEKIDDLESISRDDNDIYIAASLSHNSKGDLKSKRRKLMRLRMNNQDIDSVEVIDLYEVFSGLQYQSKIDPDLRRFISRAIVNKSLDMEAHAVVENTLYLGFKSPLDHNGDTVFLKLDDVEALFAGKSVEASMWMQLNLHAAGAIDTSRLSDFTITHSALYLLSVSRHNNQDTSYLWRFDFATQTLQQLAEFPNLSAEGLSIDTAQSSATIVFDGGGQIPSQFLRTRI